MKDETKNETAVKPESKPTMTAEPSTATLDLGTGPSKANLPMPLELLSIGSKAQKVVDLVDISEAHKAQAKQLADTFNFKDTNQVLTYAAAPQKKYVDSLKDLIGSNKLKTFGAAGDITAEITSGMELVGLEKMKKATQPWTWQHFISTIPVLNRLFSAIYLCAARQKQVAALVEKIEHDTQAQMEIIVKDNARLDIMFKDVEQNFYELGIYIYAGEMALERGKKEHDELMQKAIKSGDPVQISKANLFHEQLSAFDARLLRIKTAYGRAPVTIQKVLTTQQAGRITLSTLIESLLFDLPAFLEAMNLFLALYHLDQALSAVKSQEKLRERLDKLEEDALERISLEAKRGQIRGVKEVAMLESSATKMLDTAKKLKEADVQQAKLRQEAETHLVEIITGFRDTMKDLNRPEAA